MNLYTWAKETNLGIDQFNLQVSQWEENYKLSLVGAQIDVANATGAFVNGTPTLAAREQQRSILAASGQALLEAGVAPTVEQLEAMGMSATQAAAFLQRNFPEGATNVTLNAISSGEAANYVNKYSGLSDEAFVNQLYQDYLGRSPETGASTAGHYEALRNGMDRSQFVQAILNDTEYRNRVRS